MIPKFGWSDMMVRTSLEKTAESDLNQPETNEPTSEWAGNPKMIMSLRKKSHEERLACKTFFLSRKDSSEANLLNISKYLKGLLMWMQVMEIFCYYKRGYGVEYTPPSVVQCDTTNSFKNKFDCHLQQGLQ